MADQNFVVKLKEYRLNAVLDTVVPVLGPAGPPGPPGPTGPTGPTGPVGPPGPVTPWTQNADAASFNLSNVGQLTVQGSATAGNMVINQPAGTGSVLHLESAFSDRWTVAKDAIAETGSNAGSNFFISRYSDSGVLLGTPLTIARSTGVVNFAQTPTIAGVPIISVSQTPWLSDIQAAGHSLFGAGSLECDHPTIARLILNCTGAPVNTRASEIYTATDGGVNFALVSDDFSSNKYWLSVERIGGGVQAGRAFVAADLCVGNPGASQKLAINLWNASYPLDVAGDCNLSAGSVYRVNGVPISTGGAAQTPWTSDIDGAGFTLRNAGKVGIGMAVPPQSLLQLGSSAVTGYPTYRGSLIISEYSASLAANMGLEFHTRGDSGGYGWRLSSLANNTDFVFQSRSASAAWTERMRILNNGNVGIGTTSPSQQLSLGGYGAISMATGNAVSYLTHQYLSTPGFDCLSLAINYRRTDSSAGTISNAAIGVSEIQLLNSAITFGLGAAGNPPTEWMRITSAGSVGIGTASPLSKLSLGNVANSTNRIALYETSSSDFRGIGMAAPGGGVFGVAIWANKTPADGNFDFFVKDGGNVGIGVNPSAKLDVAGDVNCSGAFRWQGLPTTRIVVYLDQTSVRALNGVYQNTQICAIFVAVTVTINAGQFAQLLTDSNNPPANVVCAQTNATGSTVNQTCNGWVMPNQYYKVNTPSATLIKWFEWT